MHHVTYLSSLCDLERARVVVNSFINACDNTGLVTLLVSTVDSDGSVFDLLVALGDVIYSVVISCSSAVAHRSRSSADSNTITQPCAVLSHLTSMAGSLPYSRLDTHRILGSCTHFATYLSHSRVVTTYLKSITKQSLGLLQQEQYI